MENVTLIKSMFHNGIKIVLHKKNPQNFKDMIFKVFKITIKRAKYHDEKKHDFLNCTTFKNI